MSPDRIVVLGLPYAGGSAYHLQPIGRHFPPWVDFRPVELPGHGSRMSEPLLRSLEAMVEDVREHHREALSSPHVLFGHSMGATLAYLLARASCSAGANPPLLVVASGREGPPVRETKLRSWLPRPQFIEEVRRLGGLPDSVLACEELLDLFEPILRADFAAVEGYRYQDAPPLPVSFLVLSGTDDDTTAAELDAWRRVAAGPATFRSYPGGHFFLFDHAQSVARCIAEAADTLRSRAGALERHSHTSPAVPFHEGERPSEGTERCLR